MPLICLNRRQNNKIKNSYQGPLGGLNLIDFRHDYAGAMVGMNLAGQSANVISIVKPGEKELPEQQYRLLNRNKKLLTLDLKTPATFSECKEERHSDAVPAHCTGSVRKAHLQSRTTGS